MLWMNGDGGADYGLRIAPDPTTGTIHADASVALSDIRHTEQPQRSHM